MSSYNREHQKPYATKSWKPSVDKFKKTPYKGNQYKKPNNYKSSYTSTSPYKPSNGNSNGNGNSSYNGRNNTPPRTDSYAPASTSTIPPPPPQPQTAYGGGDEPPIDGTTEESGIQNVVRTNKKISFLNNNLRTYKRNTPQEPKEVMKKKIQFNIEKYISDPTYLAVVRYILVHYNNINVDDINIRDIKKDTLRTYLTSIVDNKSISFEDHVKFYTVSEFMVNQIKAAFQIQEHVDFDGITQEEYRSQIPDMGINLDSDDEEMDDDPIVDFEDIEDNMTPVPEAPVKEKSELFIKDENDEDDINLDDIPDFEDIQDLDNDTPSENSSFTQPQQSQSTIPSQFILPQSNSPPVSKPAFPAANSSFASYSTSMLSSVSAASSTPPAPTPPSGPRSRSPLSPPPPAPSSLSKQEEPYRPTGPVSSTYVPTSRPAPPTQPRGVSSVLSIPRARPPAPQAPASRASVPQAPTSSRKSSYTSNSIQEPEYHSRSSDYGSQTRPTDFRRKSFDNKRVNDPVSVNGNGNGFQMSPPVKASLKSRVGEPKAKKIVFEQYPNKPEVYRIKRLTMEVAPGRFDKLRELCS
ncbi:hypothetical protein G210_0366 [Candida maltosa Xu316]|uniref:Uncharacterized protein n=1 Tax=Candida maltosa (strain Xu316) TaxID=1245528 RepID=M3JA30_CANMX|nr:hypothetical protein G210_0366 [Candida maltosa Xu316]